MLKTKAIYGYIKVKYSHNAKYFTFVNQYFIYKYNICIYNSMIYFSICKFAKENKRNYICIR